jgi:hypothetical protein
MLERGEEGKVNRGLITYRATWKLKPDKEHKFYMVVEGTPAKAHIT